MMNEKNEKVYSSWIVYTNERLTAVNIVNYAFKLGYNGGVRRESEICADTPIDMYKVTCYGKVDPKVANTIKGYINNQIGICNFTIEK